MQTPSRHDYSCTHIKKKWIVGLVLPLHGLGNELFGIGLLFGVFMEGSESILDQHRDLLPTKVSLILRCTSTGDDA